MNNIENIDIQLFINMDAHVFWMDNDFVQQGCNQLVAEYWNLANTNDIKGKTYSDLAKLYNMQEQCDIFSLKNKRVRDSGSPLLNYITPALPNPKSDSPAYGEANLFPLKNKHHEVIGVLGICKEILLPTEIHCLQLIQDYINKDSLFNNLTPKEKQVLLIFISGCSIKMVAQQLKVSPRTIETHLEHIKQKLKIYSKPELLKLCLDNAKWVL